MYTSNRDMLGLGLDIRYGCMRMRHTPIDNIKEEMLDFILQLFGVGWYTYILVYIYMDGWLVEWFRHAAMVTWNTHTRTQQQQRCMRKTMHRGRYSERKVRIFVDGSGFRSGSQGAGRARDWGRETRRRFVVLCNFTCVHESVMVSFGWLACVCLRIRNTMRSLEFSFIVVVRNGKAGVGSLFLFTRIWCS